VVGAPTTRLLLAWRIYTSLLSIAAGIILVAVSMASTLVRRRSPTTNDASDGIAHR
jgi:hypothetical protein